MAAVIAPSAARTNITQNAAWNAFAAASPRAAGSAAPAISPARETRTVDTAATPTAPPISRMVSTSPDASPVIECVTPDSAPICADGALSPPATPHRSSAGSRSVAKCPPAGTRVSHSAEIASRDRPAMSRRRTPTTATSFAPVIAAAMNDGAAVERVDQQEQACGHGDRAGDVEASAAAAVAGVDVVDVQEAGRHRDEQDADRNVDEEDPAPAWAVGEQTTGDHPTDAAIPVTAP